MYDDIEFFDNCQECGEPIDYCNGHSGTIVCGPCCTAVMNADTSGIAARGYDQNSWNKRVKDMGNVCIGSEFTAEFSGDYECELCDGILLADDTVYRLESVN